MMTTTAAFLPPKLAYELKNGKRVVVLTGTDMSAESGIPTFSDAQTGAWAKYDPKELASLEAFQRNPRLVWDWYTLQRESVAKAEPSPGHLALVQMQNYVPEFTLITQNVDGLHQRANSKSVIELYGNLTRTKCADEGHLVDSWSAIDEIPPRCPDCGGMLRPDVVWPEESLPEDALDQAMKATQQCDLFFNIGTSNLTHPADSLPLIAYEHGAKVFEITPRGAPLTPHLDTIMFGTASRILPALMNKCSLFPYF